MRDYYFASGKRLPHSSRQIKYSLRSLLRFLRTQANVSKRRTNTAMTNAIVHSKKLLVQLTQKIRSFSISSGVRALLRVHLPKKPCTGFFDIPFILNFPRKGRIHSTRFQFNRHLRLQHISGTEFLKIETIVFSETKSKEIDLRNCPIFENLRRMSRFPS
jgi:hypothetical protein